MTPTPQEPSLTVEPDCSPTDGGRIVITGMSGLYPDSPSVKDLSDVLYNKINPVTSENPRWNLDYPEAAQRTGKISGFEHFDAQFFKVHHRQSNCMDPISRMLLEQAYQAIYDAGLNPGELDGKTVAVYIGSTFSEMERSFYVNKSKVEFAISGCSRTMFANRISYWLNVKGPSMAVDESCCSSLSALEQAYHAIKTGGCDAAIVGGANLCLLPNLTIHYKRMNKLAADGITKSFDQNADGYAMSDAINILFMQKAKDARRILAEIKNVKSEYSKIAMGATGPKFGYTRDPEAIVPIIKQFYEEAGVSPRAVEYVEAFGSADIEADKNELEVLEKVFCDDREEPLLVGSVMSNVGYTASASGITAITKVLLGYQRGELAGNLHCTTPRQDIAALRDGRMRILTEHQPFRGTYTAVNAISITGNNAHVLLQGYNKPKDLTKYKASIPRLVTLSGRLDSGVTRIIEDLKSRPVDPEEIALLHSIHSTNVAGHLGRGYVILDTNDEQKTVCHGWKTDYFNEGKRPLWFVYSGMGSQWVGMGAQLMRIPIFAAAIERCQRALAPKGLDIVDIITSSEKTMFDNILHSFVGIAAIQIGLTDILRELGLVPDGIIGHSVGELGCGYADGCFTTEEMILAAYSRGLVSTQTTFIRGSMAAIGKGFSEMSKICPPEIEIACHNGPESCTISGPAEVMQEFVAELTAKSIFAKEVPCSNIAFHSRYIADAGPTLLKYLKDVIKDPRPRSIRWLSTSVPKEKWDDPSAKYCSAEYHANNLLNAVLFEESSKVIPSNAVVVEVAPHGLLQAILKRSLPADCRHVPLTSRGHADSAVFLLQAIGKLYVEGFTPKVQNLYSKVEFPVSTGTPLLSHLVEWAHSEKWAHLKYEYREIVSTATCKLAVCLYSDDHSYLHGNVIGENIVFPHAAALVAVWDTLAMSMGVAKKQLSVRFHDVYLFSQPILQKQRLLKLTVSIQKGSRYFEIINHDNSKLASGFVNTLDIQDKNEIPMLMSTEENDYQALEVDSDTIYQLLHDRGYSYTGDFRGINSTNKDLSEAHLLWQNNWITFLDSILQLNMLRQNHNGLSLATYIENISIDIKNHFSNTLKIDEKPLMTAKVQKTIGRTSCGGVSIKGLNLRDIPAEAKHSQVFELVKLTNIESINNTNIDSLVAHNQMLQCARVGIFDSLHWEGTPEPIRPGVTVTVHYAGLNSYDVGKASGESPFERKDCPDKNAFGMDFSGVRHSGSRVMGIVASGACARRVRPPPELMWPVPAHWTLEDAATVPLAYALAFYCLVVKSQLRPGMCILVHGGAGALGQAAISIALAYGCEVVTTVSDNRKKSFLLKLFPQLKDNFIGNSREESFGDMVIKITNGKGCDITINCLKGDLKNTTQKCCAPFGSVLDMNQIKKQENYKFGMFNLFRSRSYITVDFSSIFAKANKKERQLVQVLVSEGVARGYVRPLSRVTYAACDAPRAFRLLAASQHRGRVLLDLTAHTPARDGIETGTTPILTNRITCTPNLSQLLICDGDTFALQLAAKLISCGARKICIYCPMLSVYYRLKLRFWINQGIEVYAFSENLSESNAIANLMTETIRYGPIEGIYVFNTKTSDAKNVKYLKSLISSLDTISRSLCPKLKYFGIINAGTTIGQETCVTRALSNIPASMINLPKDRQLLSADVHPSSSVSVWSAAAVSAVERALSSAHPALVARLSAGAHSFHEPLQALLFSITGISDYNEIQKHTSLHEMGVDKEKVKVICNFLQDTYDVSLREDEVSKMQIEELRELIANIAEFTIEKKNIFDTLFAVVDPDELVGTLDLIRLPNLSKDVIDGDMEFSDDQTHLFIVPGFEGHHAKFRGLCEGLKLPALVLQPGLDNIHETLQETAEKFAKVILNKMGTSKHFQILGYESGVIVALELAAILEKHDLKGTVFCIGYSPEEFKAVLQAKFCEYESEEQIQNELIKHMFSIMTDSNLNELEEPLRDVSSWEKKLDSCMRILAGCVKHSAQYTRSVIEAAYSRIVQVRCYSGQPRLLHSQIVLLRAAGTLSPPTAPNVSSLQRYSEQPVIEYNLHSPLAHITRDLRCTAIINRHLRPEILEEFEKKNLCIIYYS